MSVKCSIWAGRALGTRCPAADPQVLTKYLLRYVGLPVLHFFTRNLLENRPRTDFRTVPRELQFLKIAA